VTIHVCDDSRNAKKDFYCNQDILLSQMGYFKDITAGQSLEDVDISVHCDVTIFEWLMEWIKSKEEAEQRLMLLMGPFTLAFWLCPVFYVHLSGDYGIDVRAKSHS
jgi:hypothetical protein